VESTVQSTSVKLVEFLIYMFEIKGKNTVDAYVNEIVVKLDKHRIKHEVKILAKSNQDGDDMDEAVEQRGGNGQNELTYPYNHFSDFADRIKGVLRKPEQEEENTEKRRSFFESLFVKQTDMPTEDKQTTEEEMPTENKPTLATDEQPLPDADDKPNPEPIHEGTESTVVQTESSSMDTQNIGEDKTTGSLEYKKYYDAIKSGVVEIRILLEDTRDSYKEILVGKQELDHYIQELEPPAEPTVEPTVEKPVEPPAEPTVEPPVEPTVELTVEPNVEPPVEPTAEPTVEPPVEKPVVPNVEPNVEKPAEKP